MVFKECMLELGTSTDEQIGTGCQTVIPNTQNDVDFDAIVVRTI